MKAILPASVPSLTDGMIVRQNEIRPGAMIILADIQPDFPDKRL